MPQFTWTTGLITGNREVYGNTNAPVWDVSLSSGSVTPTGNAWKINSAYVRVCVRNAYGSQYTFFVRKGTTSGTVIGELRPDDGSTSGVWNSLRFSSTEIAEKGNFVGLTQMCFQGNGGTAMQIMGTTEITLVVNWTATTSKCTAPSVVSTPASSNIATVNLSWSGAASGTNNTITGYQVYAEDSTDGETYGERTLLTTISSTASSGTATVAMPETLGTYRRFYMVTMGNAGSSYYSDVSTAYATCLRTALATAPTSVIVDNDAPAVSDTIVISWTGAVAGVDDTISGYAIWRSDEADGEYTQIGTVTTTDTSGSYSTTSSATFGETYYYRVQTLSGTNAEYNSALSTAYASATSGYGRPTAPTTVTVSPTSAAPGSVALVSWNGAEDGYLNPITGYQVSRSTEQNGTYYAIGNTTETEMQVLAPATEGGRYYYKVSAVGTYNGYNSYLSAATAVLTASTPPAVNGSIGRTNALI